MRNRFANIRIWPTVGVLLSALALCGRADAQGQGPATAPAAKPMGLEEAIRLTLRQSNDAIRIEDEKVNGAAAKLKQASGAFDWMVTGEGGYQTLYVPHVAQGLLPNHGVLTDQTDTVGTGYISGGIGRTFRNGITVRPGVTAYPSSGASVAQTLGATQLRPSLGLQIPLMRGLGETSADAVERAAQETLKGTSLARQFAIASLVNDTVQIYWRCQATDQVARNSKDYDQRASDYENSLAKQAEKGLIEPTVVQRANAIAVARRLNVQQAENAAQDCRHDLAAATMGSGEVMAGASLADVPAMKNAQASIDALQEEGLMSLALQNRADFKAAGENVAAADAKLDGARDSTAPTLNLAIEPDRAILRYSQSIENNVGQGMQDEASAASAQAHIALSQLQTQIRQQVSITLRNLKSAYADWKILSDAAQQMDVVVIDAGGRANLGVIDRSDFVTAQSQLMDIRNQLVNAQLQYASSLATLRLVTGTIDPVQETPAAVAAKFISPSIRE